MNNIIVAIVCAIIAVLLYVVNSKIEKSEIENKNLLKIGGLGASLGLMSTLLMTFAENTGIKIDQDIMTGTPNF